jgi:hypothetical protein
MWVYRTQTDTTFKSTGIPISVHPPEIEKQVTTYEVGYLVGERDFQREEFYVRREQAATRVHYLNGGDGEPFPV